MALFSCLASVFSAQASNNQSTLDLKPIAPKVETKSNLKGSVLFQSNQWVENVGEVVGNEYFGELNIDYDSKSKDQGTLDKKFQLKSRVNNEEQMMFSITETYLRHKFGKNNDAYFGRRILPWSKLDSTWGFGKLNNRVNFDGFEPGQEGLTGVAVNFRPVDNFRVSLFGSGIYAPELNPGAKIDKEKGTIACQNAWCKAPDASADINNDGTPDKQIFYSVNMPDISEIIFRYTAGLSFALETDMFSLSGFGMRKPENNISLSVEISLDSQKDMIIADVTPEIYYHNVGGAELSVNPIDNVETYVSYLHIKPDTIPDTASNVFQYTGIKPNKKQEDYLGVGARYKNHKFFASVNYVARVSEFDISEDVLVEYPRWNQALNLSTSVDLTSKFGLSFDYKYDMLTEDRLTMVKANYLFRKNMMISAGANVIGSSSERNSYWSDFVNNDTVYSSFKYVF